MISLEVLYWSFIIICSLCIVATVVYYTNMTARIRKGKMASIFEQLKFDKYCAEIKEGTILYKQRERVNPFYEPNTDRIKIIERRGDWVKYAYETTPTIKKILKTDWTDYYLSTYPIETIYRLGYKIEENH